MVRPHLRLSAGGGMGGWGAEGGGPPRAPRRPDGRGATAGGRSRFWSAPHAEGFSLGSMAERVARAGPVHSQDSESGGSTRKERSGAHGVSEREQPSDVAGLVRKPGGSRDHAPWGPGSSPRQQTRRTPEVSSSPAPTLPANAPVPVYTSCFVKILLAGRPDAVRSRERESSGEHSRRTPPRHLPSRGMSATGRRARWAPAIAWLGGCALVGSLWLPWYSAIDDGGPYVKDAWAVFSALPILLLAVAAIGMLMGPVAVAAPHRLRLLRLPGIAFSLVMAVVCTYRLLTPHDVSAANAETGAFLATGACLVITAAWFAPAARGHGTSVPRPVDRPGGP